MINLSWGSVGPGSATNLIYVPENQGEILLVDQVVDGNVVKTAAQQWAELDAFIANDEYLSSRRGDYAERNMSRTPFENIIDLKKRSMCQIHHGAVQNRASKLPDRNKKFVQAGGFEARF